MNIQGQLAEKVSQALLAAGAGANSNPQLRPASKPQFGDYQVNGIMAIAKQLGIAPRLLAQQVIDKLDLADMAEKVELAGPGFINIFLDANWLAQQLTEVLSDPRLGVTKQPEQTIVVDYSAPNVAKEMHVGHLRSTIIGDAMVRILAFLGHKVIRANHVGDWGTQFGMLIAYLEQQKQQHSDSIALADLENFYRQAKQQYDNDADFAERARHYVVKLQQGDPHCRALWQQLVDITMQQNQLSYQRLNVTLSRADVMGESLYNAMLPAIVSDLRQRGIATESEGAIVVYLEEFKNKEGEPMGVIIQKKDGGYLYTTTDIACAKYRYEQLGADRLLYYIDSRQHQHLQQAWTIVRKAGYVPERVPLEHHMFGMMLGKDGKPFKTRAGGTIKLTELLDEAVSRAQQLIAEKNPDMDSQRQQQLAEIIGIGAVKYADLSKNRTTDYIFDWDNMLSLDGNTAPYIQYAYSRIMSIFNKTKPASSTAALQLENHYEKQLAVRLLQFDETLLHVAQEGYPHLLCNYLYDIATLFSAFYEHCPILNAEQPSQQHSRLQLASLTAKTLQQGLDLLGINTVQRM